MTIKLSNKTRGSAAEHQRKWSAVSGVAVEDRCQLSVSWEDETRPLLCDERVAIEPRAHIGQGCWLIRRGWRQSVLGRALTSKTAFRETSGKFAAPIATRHLFLMKGRFLFDKSSLCELSRSIGRGKVSTHSDIESYHFLPVNLYVSSANIKTV